MQLKRNKKYLVTIFLSFAIWHNGFSQIERITENKKDDFEANYYQKENPKDTVLVVFDTKQGKLEITEEEHEIYSVLEVEIWSFLTFFSKPLFAQGQTVG